MNQFCRMKGINREFSVARTPQQNGVAERKNRTLIEATRTMLEDSLSPTTFLAEAVNTACYVQNRVLVTKPHNKTPYELLIGRSPNLEFMRPFGCPVTILNTLDHLDKFDGKADEGTHAVNAACISINTASNIIVVGSLNINNVDSNHTNMPTLEATGIFDGAFNDRDLGAKADTNNLDSSTITASTSMETSKPLLKDKDGQETVVANSITEAEYVATSSCCGQKPQKPRRKQRKEAEVSIDELEDEDHVSISSRDPLPSGEDSSILNELMVFCTNLQEHVLDLQEEKAGQAKEIAVLKKKVSKLNKWRKSRSGGLRRLKKFGLVKRVKSPMEKDEITLDDETQRRINDDEMFGVDDLAREEVVMDSATDPVTTVKDSAAPTADVTEDEITMAQALATLKSVKPKVVVQEQEMHTTILAAATTVTTAIPTPRAKGKAKMIEPEFPLKKKEHIGIDEQYDRKLQAEEQEATRPSRAQQDKEANNSWDNMQAMMDADRLLAERLQTREREEFFKVKKARLYKQYHLKERSFDEIKELFDRKMAKMNNFIAMDSEAQKRSAIEAQESSTKRRAEHLEFDISKKQKVDEIVGPAINDFKELKSV
nr:retrovirus-related Pol polyprotein from transposon TNT 1-94 [Tanacetum cinerariifolium]